MLWDFLFCVTQENKKKNTYFYKSCSNKTARTNPKIHKHWHDIVQWSSLSLRFKFQWTGLSTEKQHFRTFLYHETDNGGAKNIWPKGHRRGMARLWLLPLLSPGMAEKARVWFVKCESALALCPHHGDIWHKQVGVWLRSPSLFWSSGLYCIETLLWLSHGNAANYRSRCETFGSVLVHL